MILVRNRRKVDDFSGNFTAFVAQERDNNQTGQTQGKTQVPVNCNIATTGHELQEMSKDALIVNSWGYGFENWVYAVLSRVRTRSGLFLNKKLNLKKKFKVPEKLLNFEVRMKERETISQDVSQQTD